MIKYTVWDRKSDLYPLVGGKLTPEQVFEKWGWTARPDATVLLIEQGGVLAAIDNLEILKHNHGISLADPLAAIAELERLQNMGAEARLEEIREEGREQVRVIVREAAALDTLSGPAKDNLKEKGVL